MDEIENRLRAAADTCIGKYGEWRAQRHDGGTREALQDAIHELRKVASRLEVELAISEREELAQRPIPIPPHRAARERPQQPGPVEDDLAGNRNLDAPPQGGHSGGIPVSRLQRRRRPPQDSAPSSSSGNGNTPPQE